jgi:hypothetical protein
MQLSNEEEDYSKSLSKFESMLKTNKVSLFDSEEFEEIILHYLDIKLLWPKLALDHNSKIYRSKIGSGRDVSIRRQTRNCRKLLNELYAIEPNNEEIYIQSQYLFKETNMKKLNC